MRVREENTRETEIDSAEQALGRLFCSRFGAANCYALLISEPQYIGDDAPRIERDSVGGAYDMEIVARRVWYVSKQVAGELIDQGWVDGGILKWGYTDRTQRRITDRGTEQWFRFVDACADSIEAFVRLGSE